MAFTYPVTLDLEKRHCVVVGAGKVAARKIQTLLTQKAEVSVISPVLSMEVKAIKEPFQHIADYYRWEYIKNAFLVIAATNDRQINEQIADDCQADNILVNVIDNKSKSSFTVSSYFTQGDLLIAVSTNGASPAVAKAIKRDLAEKFGAEYAVMLKILQNARQMAQETIKDEQKRRLFLQSLAEKDLLELIRTESAETAEKRVKTWLSFYWD